MTDPRNRQFARAVREYQRTHPGTNLPQAREIVAARASQPGRPDRIPTAPLPLPGETLDGYTKRVAAAAGVHRHRAMELLGLEPGTSATARLDELAATLPETAVRALCAATGMTSAQAFALAAPHTVRPGTQAVQHISEKAFTDGYFQRGGEGKTSTDASIDHLLALGVEPSASTTPAPSGRELDLVSYKSTREHGKTSTSTGNTTALLAARLLGLPVKLRHAEGKTFTDGDPGVEQAIVVDLDPQRSLEWPGPAPEPILIELPGSPDGQPLPTDPDVFDAATRELGLDIGARRSKNPGTRRKHRM
ncbi:TniQ family protein [Streptomyces erythrochromogenes]|uniref:TniQ family protein n=1 Tax=Streptomyces erythrochromogenes TaxID=285574 RepID=UPI00343112E6